MVNPIENQIKDRISSFVNELDLLVRKSTLEALKAVLAGGGEVPAPVRGTRPARATGGRGRRRSANVEEAAGKVLAHVQANDGLGISAIADATGIDLKTAKKAAIHLLASGALKKSGQKRGTVYHAGSGRPARKAKAGKRGKKRGRKASKAARKPQAKGKRVASSVLVPARRHHAAARKGTPKASGTDVPAALAGAG